MCISTKDRSTGRVAQVVVRQSSKHEALNSTPSTAKERDTEKETERERERKEGGREEGRRERKSKQERKKELAGGGPPGWTGGGVNFRVTIHWLLYTRNPAPHSVPPPRIQTMSS
jgi:hypothetical protein